MSYCEVGKQTIRYEIYVRVCRENQRPVPTFEQFCEMEEEEGRRQAAIEDSLREEDGY